MGTITFRAMVLQFCARFCSATMCLAGYLVQKREINQFKEPDCLDRATTHTDLELRARALGIPVRIVHNASIMNAVGVCGLQLYRFGEVAFSANLIAKQSSSTRKRQSCPNHPLHQSVDALV